MFVKKFIKVLRKIILIIIKMVEVLKIIKLNLKSLKKRCSIREYFLGACKYAALQKLYPAWVENSAVGHGNLEGADPCWTLLNQKTISRLHLVTAKPPLSLKKSNFSPTLSCKSGNNGNSDQRPSSLNERSLWSLRHRR